MSEDINVKKLLTIGTALAGLAFPTRWRAGG